LIGAGFSSARRSEHLFATEFKRVRLTMLLDQADVIADRAGRRITSSLRMLRALAAMRCVTPVDRENV